MYIIKSLQFLLDLTKKEKKTKRKNRIFVLKTTKFCTTQLETFDLQLNGQQIKKTQFDK